MHFFTRSSNQLLADFEFHLLLGRLDLADMWSWIEQNNPSAELKYHNNLHMFRMAQMAHKLLLMSNYYQQLSTEYERRFAEVILITACLWHDFGHSGGAKPDAENIQFALDAMLNWIQERGNQTTLYSFLYTGSSQGSGISGMDMFSKSLETLSGIILVTEFPFIHEPQNYLQKVIRDADVLWIMGDDAVEINLGLMEEMKPKLPADMTTRDFFKKNIAFHEGATYYTQHGKMIKDMLMPHFVRNLMYSLDQAE